MVDEDRRLIPSSKALFFQYGRKLSHLVLDVALVHLVHFRAHGQYASLVSRLLGAAI